MSAIELNRGVAFGGIGAVVANMLSTVSAWNNARAIRRELNGLSDQELNDLGIGRGDIARVSRGF